MTMRQTLGRYSAAYLIRNGVPRQIDIRDADGQSVLGSAPTLPVAPTFTSPATISPASGPSGTVFTLGLGSASGTAPVALSGVLLLDGVSVTDQITGGQYTSTAAGALTWVVTASNGTAPNATSSASASVTAALTAPVVTADPTISGTTNPTGMLTLAEGTATGNPAPTGSVQWYIGGAAISGQTGLTIDKAVHGVGSYHAVVTWSNGVAPNVSRTSNVIAVVEASAGTTPATMTSPDAWPSEGSTVTITKGTSGGVPVPGVLTLAGATVTGTDSGATLTYVIPAGGSADRALVWTPESGAAVSRTIRPALGLVTPIRVDQNAARTGTDTAVAGVTGNGTLGLAWATTGTGAEVQKVANGWQFAGGKYLMAASGLPAGNYSGGAIVLRARATAIPAASATVFQLDSTAGSRIVISQSTAGTWLASTNGASGNNTAYLIPSDVAVGGDILIGLEWDYNGGASRSRLIGMDGYAGDWIAANSTVFLAMNQMRMGQNFVGTVEIVAATLRPEGGAYPIQPLDLWQRVANKRIEDRAVLDAGPVQIIDGGGQSLWLGYQTPQPQRDHINLIDRAGVRIPAGLVSTAGSPIITSMGSTNNDLDQSVPATGLMPAAVYSFGPVQHYMLVALRKRRALLGLPNPQLVSLGHGISGQSIDEFDDDTPLTGALGLRIQNNRQYMTQQAWAVTAGRTRSYPYSLWVQGEADSNDAAGTYYTALMELLDNWGDHVEATTGQRPTPLVTQIGTYVNQPALNYNVRREQVQACLDSGGVFGAPWYPHPLADNHVHPGVTETMLMGDTLAWAITEVEQGNGWPALIPTATRDGADLVLTYPEPMALHDAAKYAPYGGVVDAGFHDAGTISAVSASGSNIRLTTAATSWRYAEQNYDTSGAESGGLNYGPSRGLVRAARTAPSVLVPGETLYRFAPAWSGAV